MSRPPAIAAIDVGSSAARLTIAQLLPDERIRPLFFHRYPVRLGAGAFAADNQRVVPQALAQELYQAMADMRRHLDAHQVVAFRAVATSAMREADNGAEIARHASEWLQGPLTIIDGETEAELSRRALVTAMQRAGEPLDATALLLDLGGGSLELAESSGTKRASLPVGSVRLLSALPALKQALSLVALAEVRAAIERRLHAALLDSVFCERAAWQHAVLVGTGGNLEVMARLLPPTDGRAGIDLGRAESLIPEVAGLTVSERQRRYQLKPERADLMLPALLIISLVGAAFASRFVRVPGSGLRDALLHEIALNLRARSG